MTYNEKKSLYESIMKDVAMTVKRKINEAGVAPLIQQVGYEQLYRLLKDAFLFSDDKKKRKGIIIKMPKNTNGEPNFVLKLIIEHIFEKRMIIGCGLNDDEFVRDFGKYINKSVYHAIVFDDVEYANPKMVSLICNLADGRYNDEIILEPVIVIGTDISAFEATPIKQRFSIFELKPTN